LRPRSVAQIGFATSLALSLVASPVLADEGGVSFWAPGQFGSFSAVPTTPGWSVPLVYYHVSADADAEGAVRRQKPDPLVIVVFYRPHIINQFP
jgi:hypothetical protein